MAPPTSTSPSAAQHGGMSARVVHGENIIACTGHADGVTVEHDCDRIPTVRSRNSHPVIQLISRLPELQHLAGG